MKMELIILILANLLAISSLWLIPRNKVLGAHLVFLFAGMPIWLLGLAVVELGWIEYPFRELYQVNRTSFLFEYLVLPIIAVHFCLNYPQEKSKTTVFLYYALFCSAISLTEYILEIKTKLITYIHWECYWTWLSTAFIFWLCRITYVWFFKTKKK